jgi:uncharacterized protein (TIGR02646 family)
VIKVRLRRPSQDYVQAARAELIKARAQIRAGQKFEYQVYRMAKDALFEIFNGKCAYCESVIKGDQFGDVEHYRPKGGVLVNNKLVPPGYYWLAASWDNLLLSCAACNQERNREIVGVGRIKAGKANQFPLLDESKRAKRARELAREKPLLLNPYRDDPQKHLTFVTDDEEKLGLVQPKLDRWGRESLRGKASIEVYALQRRGLVEVREIYIKEIRRDIARIKNLRTVALNMPGTPGIDNQIVSDIEALMEKINPDRPFAAAARQLITPFMKSLM